MSKIEFPSIDQFNAAQPDHLGGTHSDIGTIIGWQSDPQRYPQMHRERVMIRVEVTPYNGISVAGTHCKGGVNYLAIYKHDLDKVRAMVPTEKHRALRAIAKDTFDAAFRQYMKDTKLTEKEADAQRGFSIETHYYQLVKDTPDKGGYPPIESLEIGPDLPPPETMASIRTQQVDDTAAALARALAAVLPALQGKGKQAGA